MDRKNKRRMLGLLLCMLVVFSAFAGCGKKKKELTTEYIQVITEAEVTTEATTATEEETTEAVSEAEPTEEKSTEATVAEVTTEKETVATTEEVTTEEVTESSEPQTYNVLVLKQLKNTGIFNKSAIEHIFEGQVNKKGNASGYHYDMIENTPGYIVPGTESKEDAHGVYTAKVEVNGVKKSGNKGYSTFYPKNLSPQEVVDLINEAYNNKVHVTGNTYAGDTSLGIEIDMYLDDNGKIISAFPIYEK